MNKFGVQSIRVQCPGYDLTEDEAGEFVNDLLGIDPTSNIPALGNSEVGWVFILRDIGDFKYGVEAGRFIGITVGTGELKDGKDTPEPFGF